MTKPPLRDTCVEVYPYETPCIIVLSSNPLLLFPHETNKIICHIPSICYGGVNANIPIPLVNSIFPEVGSQSAASPSNEKSNPSRVNEPSGSRRRTAAQAAHSAAQASEAMVRVVRTARLPASIPRGSLTGIDEADGCGSSALLG